MPSAAATAETHSHPLAYISSTPVRDAGSKVLVPRVKVGAMTDDLAPETVEKIVETIKEVRVGVPVKIVEVPVKRVVEVPVDRIVEVPVEQNVAVP
ncbi:hypothetical protein VP01_11994g1, partial [Puccinia sorghi]